jgi:hypothetical protein
MEVQVWIAYSTYDPDTDRCARQEGMTPWHVTTSKEDYESRVPSVCMNWYTGTVELTPIPKEGK